MKTILLLGGSGYIGSKFYSTYYDTYNIKSIDLQLFGTDSYSVQMNYNELDDIGNYEIILCFAAHSSVNMCEYSPERSWINNIDYFKNLCEKLNKDQKLIYMSSASVYGNTNKIALEDINININPVQNYDLQKTIIDMIANKYKQKNIIGLRLGTVNGSSPHTRKDLMLNSMTINAIDNGFINIKNLEMKRSVLGISDLMRAINTIISSEKKISGQYNLCSFTLNVKQFSKIVSELSGAKINEMPSDNVFYSFEMSTNKFCKNFDFIFNDTPESIIKDIIDNHKYTKYSVRNDDANFKQFI